MKYTPFDYQREDVQAIEAHDGTILNASDMGLGKTFETLWAILRNPHWCPVLVVCPGAVKFNWQHEATHHVGLATTVCEGRTPPRYNANDFSMHTPITVINYSILPSWLPYLKNLGFKTLVCDECQELQNTETKKVKAVLEVGSWVKRKMMLSGTVINNRIRELYAVVHILWPKEFPNFKNFAHRFCAPEWTPYRGWQYNGSSNLPELHALLKRLGMIRRRKIDELPGLPKKARRVIPCELSRPEEYEHASKDFIGWLKQTMAHRVHSAEQAEALTRVGYLLRLAARLKFRTPVEWANRFLQETDEKLVLFAVHSGAVDVLKRRIEAESVVIDGTTDALTKHNAALQFQHDERTRVLIGSRTAWTGINLTAAHTVGATEFWWQPGALAQMEDRVWRIGQTERVWINYFAAIGTIEERVCEIIQGKQGNISSILDGGPCAGDLNIYEMLLNEIEGGL